MTKGCPCGGGAIYEACCAPFIRGDARAPTAEALMRSRYTAYARRAIDYLVETDTSTGPDLEEGVRAWASRVEFTKLEVLRVVAGGEDDEDGLVEFRAHYLDGDRVQVQHERSRFVRRDGRWLFDRGAQIGARLSTPGRNDPCSCGSGKKYKKCCGA